MTLKIIGAGISRTGTTSLKAALETLGFGKCYHMDEVIKNREHVQLWIDAAEDKPVDWDALFDGYQAAVDLPTFVFYEQLMAHYPEAKVILTTKDPDAWFASAKKTLFRLPPPFMMVVFQWLSLVRAHVKPLLIIEPVVRIIGYKRFFGDDIAKENAIRVFNEHNEKVRQTVPAEKLLVYDIKEGWGPLCAFLGVPVPEEPFPGKKRQG